MLVPAYIRFLATLVFPLLSNHVRCFCLPQRARETLMLVPAYVRLWPSLNPLTFIIQRPRLPKGLYMELLSARTP